MFSDFGDSYNIYRACELIFLTSPSLVHSFSSHSEGWLQIPPIPVRRLVDQIFGRNHSQLRRNNFLRARLEFLTCPCCWSSGVHPSRCLSESCCARCWPSACAIILKPGGTLESRCWACLFAQIPLESSRLVRLTLKLKVKCWQNSMLIQTSQQFWQKKCQIEQCLVFTD